MLVWLTAAAAAYLFFALVTFGHLYRNTDRTSKAILLGASALWPVYWIVTRGVTETGVISGRAVRSIFVGLGLSEEFSTFIIFFIALFTGGYVLAKHWPSCTTAMDCSGVAVKAAAAVLGFPFYWGWLAAL
jgi:hypothetical protein